MPKEIHYRKAFLAFVILAGVIYSCFIFTAAPTSVGRYMGLVGIKLFFVQITCIIPFIATWVMGALAVDHLKSYGDSLTDRSTRVGYGHIATGIVFLIFGMIAAPTVASIQRLYQGNDTGIAFLRVLQNYIYVFFPLIGCIFFFRGAQALASPLKIKRDTYQISFLIVVLLGVIFSLIVFTNQARQVSFIPGITPSYYIPDMLIVLTVIVPCMVAWFFGFCAVLIMGEIPSGKHGNVDGCCRLSSGMLLVIFSSIILQGMVSFGAGRFMIFGLGLTLFLIYLFLILMGMGHMLIVFGAKNLLKNRQ